jgi:hypothetical protein
MTSLAQVTLGPAVTAIVANAFSGCTGLTSFTVPAGVSNVAANAFTGCTGIATVNLDGPAAGTLDAFDTLTHVTAVNLGETFGATLTADSFGASAGLLSINVDPANAKYANNGAGSASDGVLYEKTGAVITSVVKYPPAKAGAITLPTTVTSIPENAFKGAALLTAITIPANILTIDLTAFDGCNTLSAINVTTGGTSTTFSSLDGVLFGTRAGTTVKSIVKYPKGKGASYTIPNTSGITAIGEGAFADSSLTSLVVNVALVSVGDDALPQSCTALVLNANLGVAADLIAPAPAVDLDGTFPTISSLTVGSAVTYIDTKPFEDSSVSNITTLTLDTATAEGIDAFDQITTLNLGPTISSVSSLPLSSYTSLTGIGVDSMNPNYSASAGTLYNKLGTSLEMYVPLNPLTSFIVAADSTLATISAGAFTNCNILDTLVLNKVVTIAAAAFKDCTTLETLVLGAVPTLNVSGSFDGCTSLDTLDLRIPLTAAITNFPTDITNLIIGATGVNLSSSVFSIVDTLVVDYALGTIDPGAFGTALENLEVNVNLTAAFPVLSVTSIKIGAGVTIASNVFSTLTLTGDELYLALGAGAVIQDNSFKTGSDPSAVSLKNAYTVAGDYEFDSDDGWSKK